ncbi:MAG: YncE family protein [Candidatus Ventricola sp.]
MERELIVSTGGGIRVCALSGEVRQQTALEGAGALCAAEEHLLCACGNGREIFRLDRRTLMPQALYPGGPGVCDLRMSQDGRRLAVLCGDADSVMMLDARSGQPLFVSRVGCNPRQMALEGDTLAIAGGESGCVHLISARTLEAEGCLSMPGPVYSAAIGRGRVYALCLTQTLDSLLVTAQPGGARQMQALCGMPGCLLLREELLLAATQRRLYAVSVDGGRVLSQSTAPGRARRMLEDAGRLFACDLLGERLFACQRPGGRWRPLHAGVRDMAII